MSEEAAEFQCMKCQADPPPEGADTSPMSVEALPVVNDYWRRVAAVTCARCWADWKDMEVKIINEYRLNMLDREHRQMLRKAMKDFLNLDGTSKTAGQALTGIPKE